MAASRMRADAPAGFGSNRLNPARTGSDHLRTGRADGVQRTGKIEMKTKHAGRKLALTVLVLFALAAFLTAGTMALFTDAQTVPGNGFTTGTIDLTTAPASAVVTLGNMAPGDVTTNSLVVQNAGTLPLRYDISSVATNPDLKGLKDQLVLEIKGVDVTTPAVPCDNFDGVPLYTGDLDAVAGQLVGNPAQGAQAGDRLMASGTNETLCFRVSLPLATGNAFQAATTTATFTFNAEQTSNNP
jgi:predicted ribosomally synthesized peptide with SipW-like signal peptide